MRLSLSCAIVAGRQGLSIGEVVYSQRNKEATAGVSDALSDNWSVDMVEVVKSLQMYRGTPQKASSYATMRV